MSDQSVMDKIAEPFPAALLQDKRGLTYVEAEYYREKLNEATNGAYDWEFVKIDFRLDGAVKPVGIKNDKGEITEWREPVVCQYIGKLTIPGLGSRIGIGVQEIQVGGGADSAYKGAESDAFKRACMAFGMGLRQLYIDTNKHEQERARREAYEANKAQQAQSRTERPMSPKEYGERVQKAMDDHNGPEFAACVALAGTDVRRWCILIAKAQNEQGLDWIKGRIPHDLLDNSMVIEEMRQRERAFRATEPKPIADQHQAITNPDKTAPPDAETERVPPPGKPATQGQRDMIRQLAAQADCPAEKLAEILGPNPDGMSSDDAKDAIAVLTDMALSKAEAS